MHAISVVGWVVATNIEKKLNNTNDVDRIQSDYDIGKCNIEASHKVLYSKAVQLEM